MSAPCAAAPWPAPSPEEWPIPRAPLSSLAPRSESFFFSEGFQGMPYHLAVSRGFSELLSIVNEAGQIALVRSGALWSPSTPEQYLPFASLWPGHRSSVLFSSFLEGDDRLATCSCDCSCKVWDIEYLRELHQLTGHFGSVKHCSFFAPQPSILASSSQDGSFILYDLRKKESLLMRSEPVKGCLSAVHCLEDGRSIVTSGYDGHLRFYDARLLRTPVTCRLLGSIQDCPTPHTPPAIVTSQLSPDGWTIGLLTTESKIFLVDLTRASNGAPVRVLSAPGMNYFSNYLAFSPDASRVSCGTLGGSLPIWEIGALPPPLPARAAGEARGPVPPEAPALELNVHTDHVAGVVWARTNEFRLFSCADDLVLAVHDLLP